MSTANLEWHKQSEESLWDGYRKLEKWTFRLPSGSVYDFEIKKDNNPVCIPPITKGNKVVIARQFRPGPMKVLDELPGGGVEPGEEPIDAARRELLEETGYTGSLHYLADVHIDAYSTQTRRVFVATQCYKVQEPQNHEREPIEVVEISIDEFRDNMRSGRLTDIATGYLGLDYLNLL